MNDASQNIFRLQDLHGKQFLLLFSSIYFMKNKNKKGIITVTSFNRNEDQGTRD